MKLFWITLLISSLVSCHNFKEDRQLSFALERAGENRRELEQVLAVSYTHLTLPTT